jgi:hypothetical protein
MEITSVPTLPNSPSLFLPVILMLTTDYRQYACSVYKIVYWYCKPTQFFAEQKRKRQSSFIFGIFNVAEQCKA